MTGVVHRPKLIEVALPLAAINAAAAREKSIRHAASLYFASLVGSPSVGGDAGGDLGFAGGRSLW